MRVLFTTTSGRGHFQPMVPLARALVRAGHEMRWAGAEDVCATLRAKGFDALPAGLFEIVPSPLRNPPPEIAALPPAERPDLLFALVFGPLRAEAMLADLMPIVEDWRPHLLVCEQGELAGPIAAARHDVPNVTHAFGRLLPAARVARARESMADLWRAHGLESRPYAGTYDHLYVDIYPPSLQADDTAHLGAVQLVRPADPIATDGAAEPLVYITLGTVFNDDLELFLVAVEAARELGIRGGRDTRTRERPRGPRPAAVARDREAVHPPVGLAPRLCGRRVPCGVGHVPRRARSGRAAGAAATGRRSVPQRAGRRAGRRRKLRSLVPRSPWSACARRSSA